MVVSRSQGRAAFPASGLPRPAAGKVYQMWFYVDGRMRPAALLAQDRSDLAVLMKGPVGKASARGVTVEPAGGSAHPTTPPIALLNFPSA